MSTWVSRLICAGRDRMTGCAVTGSHQITPDVLARTDQVARSLLLRLGHPHRHELTEPQKPISTPKIKPPALRKK